MRSSGAAEPPSARRLGTAAVRHGGVGPVLASSEMCVPGEGGATSPLRQKSLRPRLLRRGVGIDLQPERVVHHLAGDAALVVGRWLRLGVAQRDFVLALRQQPGVEGDVST